MLRYEPLCEGMAHVCRCLWRPEKGVRSPGWGYSQCWFWELNLVPWVQQEVLLKGEPFLQLLLQQTRKNLDVRLDSKIIMFLRRWIALSGLGRCSAAVRSTGCSPEGPGFDS